MDICWQNRGYLSWNKRLVKFRVASVDPLDEAMNNFWVTKAADTGVESFANTIKSYLSGSESNCRLNYEIENSEERYQILDKIKNKVKKFSEIGQEYNS